MLFLWLLILFPAFWGIYILVFAPPLDPETNKPTSKGKRDLVILVISFIVAVIAFIPIMNNL